MFLCSYEVEFQMYLQRSLLQKVSLKRIYVFLDLTYGGYMTSSPQSEDSTLCWEPGGQVTKEKNITTIFDRCEQTLTIKK